VLLNSTRSPVAVLKVPSVLRKRGERSISRVEVAGSVA
jgi:hypothetical protein